MCTDIIMLCQRKDHNHIGVYNMSLEMSCLNQREKQCTYQHEREVRWRNHCDHGQAIHITYSECVCNFKLPIMQCACAILPSMSCPAVQTFSKLSKKTTRFSEKGIENKMCL